MTITYSLSRLEIVRGFWTSLANSTAYRNKLLVFAATAGIVFWRMQIGFARSFGLQDAAAALIGIPSFLIFISLFLFLRAKTTQRTLSIAEDGIYTEIGKLKGQVAWSSIAQIEETKSGMFIARNNGNAFYVPNRSFADSEQRASFLEQVRRSTNLPR